MTEANVCEQPGRGFPEKERNGRDSNSRSFESRDEHPNHYNTRPQSRGAFTAVLHRWRIERESCLLGNRQQAADGDVVVSNRSQTLQNLCERRHDDILDDARPLSANSRLRSISLFANRDTGTRLTAYVQYAIDAKQKTSTITDARSK